MNNGGYRCMNALVEGQMHQTFWFVLGFDMFDPRSKASSLWSVQVPWRQAKVVARDLNTGELGLRYNEKGQSVSAGLSGSVGSVDPVVCLTIQKSVFNHQVVFSCFFFCWDSLGNVWERFGVALHPAVMKLWLGKFSEAGKWLTTRVA